MLALVLDDSSAMRSILRRTLRRLGFDVIEAVNVADALELVDRTGPLDLALVDWNLPGSCGLEFVRGARAGRHGLQLKVIMVTTELQSSRVIEALHAGVDEYLMKPFTPDMLESKLALLGLADRTDRRE